ncbi:MAG: peptidoglycan D,D-transpeptidase FtsI family protein [Actinomycetota bacterium]
MNSQIRIVAMVILGLFGALFINLSWIQLVDAEKLANNPANTRLLLKEYSLARGAIRTSDGKTVAMSEETPAEALKFLRKYPEGPLFSHAVGFYSVRYQRAGLEQSHNKELTGSGGVVTMQDLGDKLLGKGEQGDNLVLSIDSRVQQAASDALGARKGAIVALDPLNGQILALVSKPDFDPNPISQHSSEGQQQAWDGLNKNPDRPLNNRAATETYPPGSTFKLITAAAALENGVSPDTSFPPADGYKAPQTDRVIGNFGDSTCGGNMADALRVSCNAYFARLGAELPRGALEKTAKAFGFTEKPPLDSRAVASRLPDSSQLKSPAFAALTSIGQLSVSATPLQMALVAAGIGNSGKVPVPQFVKQVEDARGGIVETASAEIWKEAVSPENAETIKQMMIGVVEGGSGRGAAIPGIKVAGKTGTAQAGASGQNTLAWFVAVAPADAPRIAIAVVVEGPGEGSTETGGKLAAPMAKSVLQAHRSAAGW